VSNETVLVSVIIAHPTNKSAT